MEKLYLHFSSKKERALNLKKGVTILLLVIIIGAILVSVLVAVEVMIRQTHALQGFNFSEKALLASLSGQDATAYNVFDNYCQVDTDECNLQKTLSDNSQYSTNVSLKTTEPNTGQTSGVGQNITPDNPWEINLKANEYFTLYLDLNSSSPIYPDSLTVSQKNPTPAFLVFSKCLTSSDSPRVCTEKRTPTVSVTFPTTFDLSESSSHYYSLTIQNGPIENTYVLTPSEDTPLRPLPVGVKVISNGIFADYERTITSNLLKWRTGIITEKKKEG